MGETMAFVRKAAPHCSRPARILRPVAAFVARAHETLLALLDARNFFCFWHGKLVNRYRTSSSGVNFLEQHGNLILINGLPVPSFAQYGGEDRINREERRVHTIPRQDIGPLRARVPPAQSFVL